MRARAIRGPRNSAPTLRSHASVCAARSGTTPHIATWKAGTTESGQQSSNISGTVMETEKTRCASWKQILQDSQEPDISPKPKVVTRTSQMRRMLACQLKLLFRTGDD